MRGNGEVAVNLLWSGGWDTIVSPALKMEKITGLRSSIALFARPEKRNL